MKVNIVSDTIQEFNGLRYYLCGRYFQRKGSRLHRQVWIYHNGKIPKGYHVHHKDLDPVNNNIKNLQLLPYGNHLKYHAGLPENIEAKKEHMEKILRPKAIEWHKSEAAKELHRRIGKIKKRRYPMKCLICGNEYMSAHPSRSKYCGNNCKAKALRRRRRENKIDLS